MEKTLTFVVKPPNWECPHPIHDIPGAGSIGLKWTDSAGDQFGVYFEVDWESLPEQFKGLPGVEIPVLRINGKENIKFGCTDPPDSKL